MHRMHQQLHKMAVGLFVPAAYLLLEPVMLTHAAMLAPAAVLM
jgi:hypothetical protein